MGGLFAADGKLAQTLGKIADLVILNVLWIVCSIPVVTAGAAATAFYSVALKMIKNEEAYVASSFFKAFRENFKQSFIVTLILLAVAAVLGCDFYFCTTQRQTTYSRTRLLCKYNAGLLRRRSHPARNSSQV